MENGKAKQLLDRIQDIVGEGQNVPFAAGKVLVNKEEVLEIVEELKTTIDLELKAYHEITDKRSKIIKEAEQEADEIIADAEEAASRIRLSKPSPLFVDRKVRVLASRTDRRSEQPTRYMLHPLYTPMRCSWRSMRLSTRHTT